MVICIIEIPSPPTSLFFLLVPSLYWCRFCQLCGSWCLILHRFGPSDEGRRLSHANSSTRKRLLKRQHIGSPKLVSVRSQRLRYNFQQTAEWGPTKRYHNGDHGLPALGNSVCLSSSSLVQERSYPDLVSLGERTREKNGFSSPQARRAAAILSPICKQTSTPAPTPSPDKKCSVEKKQGETVIY